jgi:hypothetical protein
LRNSGTNSTSALDASNGMSCSRCAYAGCIECATTASSRSTPCNGIASRLTTRSSSGATEHSTLPLCGTRYSRTRRPAAFRRSTKAGASTERTVPCANASRTARDSATSSSNAAPHASQRSRCSSIVSVAAASASPSQ